MSMSIYRHKNGSITVTGGEDLIAARDRLILERDKLKKISELLDVYEGQPKRIRIIESIPTDYIDAWNEFNRLLDNVSEAKEQ